MSRITESMDAPFTGDASPVVAAGSGRHDED
jgi:hypothetical protein